MSDPDILTDWVDEEYDPEEQTPLEFVKEQEFLNAGAGAIALERAEAIHRDVRSRDYRGAEPKDEGDEGDELLVRLDTRADRLREPSGRFIGWVKAAVKYIRKHGRF